MAGKINIIPTISIRVVLIINNNLSRTSIRTKPKINKMYIGTIVENSLVPKENDFFIESINPCFLINTYDINAK